jgi:hypothetical protein
VISTPPLPCSNRFSVLEIHEVVESIPELRKDEVVHKYPPNPSSNIPTTPRIPKWEKQIIQSLVINLLEEGPNSLSLPIQLVTLDTMLEVGTNMLVDSGATGDFIDSNFVRKHNLPTRNRS